MSSSVTAEAAAIDPIILKDLCSFLDHEVPSWWLKPSSEVLDPFACMVVISTQDSSRGFD